MKRSTTNRAFTLVELLVVIGIIAIMIAILMPALKAARMQAVNVKCQSNLRQVFLALQSYAGDNKGWIPQPTGHDGVYVGNTTTHQSTERPSWADFLYPRKNVMDPPTAYITNVEVLRCVAFQKPAPTGGVMWINYALNQHMFTSTGARWITTVQDYGWNRSGPISFYRLSATRRSSEVYLVSESKFEGDILRYMKPGNKSWWPRLNHKSKANVVYHDGHVGQVDENDLTLAAKSPAVNKEPWRNSIK